MKSRTKENTRISILVALFVSCIGLSVGYAALSQTLKIEGTASVAKASWKIVFQNLSSASLTGDATEVVSPKISDDGTTLGTYNVEFKTPGDSVTYTFDVANLGTFDATLSEINISTPTCSGSGDNASNDATNICNHLSYTLTYSDGTSLALNDNLPQETSKSLILTLTYKDDIAASELPNDDVSISNLSITLTYSQIVG